MKTSNSIKGDTARVRRYAQDHYVRPARRERRTTFKVVVGEIHKALGFSNRVPLVCNALSSRKFLEENSLRLINRTGPPSGQSTTVMLTYELLEGSSQPEPFAALHALRGAGKEIFRSLGGGEAFLRKERASFAAVSESEKGSS
jgi:hypothetical protein